MIGKLKGKVDTIEGEYCIIDVRGVGYLVNCSRRTLDNLVLGHETQLIIQTHVREDCIRLYGFGSSEEKEIFTILQSVKGVGTRMALTMLSYLTPNDIIVALSRQDKNVFLNISGVGKKLAERIVSELKDKFSAGIVSSNIEKSTNVSDVVSALVNLGIKNQVAMNRVNKIISENPNIGVDDMIRIALKME